MRAARVALGAVFLLVWALPLSSQSLDRLVTVYRNKPTAANRAPLERFARANARKQDGALASMALGVVDLERGDYDSAISRLKTASPVLPQLNDYLAWWTASAQYRASRYDAVLTAIEPVAGQGVVSPLSGQAVLLLAQARMESGNAADAVALLKKRMSQLPAPNGMALLAQAEERAGDGVAAAFHYQQVYYGYPTSPQATAAAKALQGLEASLGTKYPTVTPELMLDRATNLMSARRYDDARREFSDIIPLVGGLERERARLGLGAASYRSGRNGPAYDYLKSLDLSDPELDAERLYYLVELSRRLDRESEIAGLTAKLGREHPKSPWRRKALLSAGNQYLLRNDADSYLPYYKACSEGFPGDDEGAYCDWKVVWNAWMKRAPEAGDLLRDHLKRFPSSEKVPAALYYLGRLSEYGRKQGAAHGYYSEIVKRFPNHYYAVLARNRMAQKEVNAARPSLEVATFLDSLPLSSREKSLDFTASATTRSRLERARLLSRAGLLDYAEQELRFGSRNGMQPQIAALELARTASRQGSPDRAIRYIKGLVPNYLHVRPDSAPDEFWRLAFPLPFRSLMEKYAGLNSIDLYVLAGLIRQESEFNPKATSVANARGLTQIMPPTGKELSRKLGVKRFSSSLLYQPDLNLRLGTHYFKSLQTSLDGKVEAVLASYNAGYSRAVDWLKWGEFREASEYIETIPFTQTREYVQMVLRNAEIYRTLYTPTRAASEERKSVPARRRRAK